MKSQVTGIVVNGELKLDQRIDLPDNSPVQVTVEPVEEWQARFQAGLQGLRELCNRHPIHSGGRRYSRDELHERR